jgi:hypothetical protein
MMNLEEVFIACFMALLNVLRAMGWPRSVPYMGKLEVGSAN